MTKEDLLKLKAHIEAEGKAVDTLLARMSEPRIAQSKAIAAAINAKSKSGYVWAEEIIKQQTGTFNVSDIVMKVIAARGSGDYGAVVSQVVNKLKQRTPPEIKVEVEGKGSRSGVYRYIKPN